MSAFGRRPARERVAVRAVRRREDVAVLHRAADADADRLLADRDVQEAGQLAGAEPLLDLLLEAADQQHVAQELRQLLLRQLVSASPRGHDPSLRILLRREACLAVGRARAGAAAGLDGDPRRAHGPRPATADRAAALLGGANPLRRGDHAAPLRLAARRRSGPRRSGARCSGSTARESRDARARGRDGGRAEAAPGGRARSRRSGTR